MMGTGDQSPFELTAGNPALDLVNTLDHRFREQGAVELLESYDDLLRFMQQSKMLTSQQARRLSGEVKGAAAERALQSARELREAIAKAIYTAVDGASPAAAVIGTIEQHFLSATRHRELAWKQSRLQWAWSRFEKDAELPVWMLALAASELMTSDAMERVRACSSERCRWLFLDTSKNHSRRWCNMKICGNRMKARRFQARREE